MSRVRVEATVWPRRLADLEYLCRVAREKGMDDEAIVSIDGQRRTVTVEVSVDDEALR